MPHPRTDHRGRAQIGLPVGFVLPQVRDEAIAVGIVGMDLAVGAKDQRVGGTDQGRAVRDRVGQRQDRLLVGNGDIGADETGTRQDAQNLGQMFGHYRDRHVMAGQAIAGQPMSVQARRARMRDGHADHAGQGRVGDLSGGQVVLHRLDHHVASFGAD